MTDGPRRGSHAQSDVLFKEVEKFLNKLQNECAHGSLAFLFSHGRIFDVKMQVLGRAVTGSCGGGPMMQCRTAASVSAAARSSTRARTTSRRAPSIRPKCNAARAAHTHCLQWVCDMHCQTIHSLTHRIAPPTAAIGRTMCAGMHC